MTSKVLFRLTAVTLLALLPVLYRVVSKSGTNTPFHHVFINETSDHRFDESIQVSILSSFNRTHVQNAVVISDRFSSTDLNSAAAELFKTLKLGQHTQGRALLYLFSPRASSLKIEVGYALEGVLPDAHVHMLEQAAKTFIFTDHYQDFWAELINTANIEIYERENLKGEVTEDFDFSKFRFLSGGAGIISNRYLATPGELEKEMNRLKPEEKSRFTPDADIRVTVENYLESLHKGLGDENLPLLARESRIFRQITPMTNYQLYRNWKMYSRAGIDRVFTEGKEGFVFFRPGYPVLPLVLRNENGVWKVQEPLSWSLFQRFEDSMKVFLKYPLNSSSSDLNSYIAGAFGKPIYNGPIIDLEALYQGNFESRSLLQTYFRLYWLDQAVELVENNPSLKWTDDLGWVALDVYSNLGQFSKALSVMEKLVRAHPEDVTWKRNYDFYKNAYHFTGPDWTLSLNAR